METGTLKPLSTRLLFVGRPCLESGASQERARKREDRQKWGRDCVWRRLHDDVSGNMCLDLLTAYAAHCEDVPAAHLAAGCRTCTTGAKLFRLESQDALKSNMVVMSSDMQQRSRCRAVSANLELPTPARAMPCWAAHRALDWLAARGPSEALGRPVVWPGMPSSRLGVQHGLVRHNPPLRYASKNFGAFTSRFGLQQGSAT